MADDRKTVAYFKSPDELEKLIFQSLTGLRLVEDGGATDFTRYRRSALNTHRHLTPRATPTFPEAIRMLVSILDGMAPPPHD